MNQQTDHVANEMQDIEALISDFFHRYAFKPVEVLHLPSGRTVLLDENGKDYMGKQWSLLKR